MDALVLYAAIVLSLMARLGRTLHMTQYNMDMLCGREVHLRDYQFSGLIDFNTSRGHWMQEGINVPCWLSITTSDVRDQIAVSVIRANLSQESTAPPNSCTQAYICTDLYSCEHWNVFDTITICNGEVDAGSQRVYRTPSNRLLIFLYYGTLHNLRSFQLFFNVIRIGMQCASDEVRCATSGWCVHQSITCLGYDVCGDDTRLCSNTTQSSPMIKSNTIMAVVVAVLLLILLGIILYCCLGKYRMGRRTGGDSGQASGSSQGVINQAMDIEFQELDPEAFVPPPEYSSLENITAVDFPPSYEAVISNQDVYNVKTIGTVSQLVSDVSLRGEAASASQTSSPNPVGGAQEHVTASQNNT